MLGKTYKMAMPDSLAIVQKLYEEGYVTYPRTNSEYLATAEKDKVKKILEAVGRLGYPVEFKDSKSIFDDSKIESHSALTPTFKIPARTRLTPDESKVYAAIIRPLCGCVLRGAVCGGEDGNPDSGRGTGRIPAQGHRDFGKRMDEIRRLQGKGQSFTGA